MRSDESAGGGASHMHARGGGPCCGAALQEGLKKTLLHIVKYPVPGRGHGQITSCCGPKNTKQQTNKQQRCLEAAAPVQVQDLFTCWTRPPEARLSERRW